MNQTVLSQSTYLLLTLCTDSKACSCGASDFQCQIYVRFTKMNNLKELANKNESIAEDTKVLLLKVDRAAALRNADVNSVQES